MWLEPLVTALAQLEDFPVESTNTSVQHHLRVRVQMHLLDYTRTRTLLRTIYVLCAGVDRSGSVGRLRDPHLGHRGPPPPRTFCMRIHLVYCSALVVRVRVRLRVHVAVTELVHVLRSKRSRATRPRCTRPSASTTRSSCPARTTAASSSGTSARRPVCSMPQPSDNTS